MPKQLQERTQNALLNVMEDLEVEKAKDEAILASIGDGIVVTDQDMRVTLVNHVVEELTGWSSKEILGKLWGEVIELRDKNMSPVPSEKSPLFLAIDKKKITAASAYFYTRKDKTVFPVSITVSPVMLRGEPTGAVVVFRDITREQEIDKAKTEFVSVASHQLRTPLGIVKWYLEVLQNENYLKKAPNTIRDYFAEVNKSNERVITLVGDLLSVSRIDAGTVRNAPKSVNLGQITKDVIKELRVVTGNKKINLHLEVERRKLPNISVDNLRLHEVIENLILNAINYSPVSGSVEVTVGRNGDFLVLSVKDTGIGISAKDKNKLFTKFFRAEKAVSKNPEGSGLGLYVVKSYVEEWGGKVAVESVEGKGSTFTITLPLKGGERNEKNTSR